MKVRFHIKLISIFLFTSVLLGCNNNSFDVKSFIVDGNDSQRIPNDLIEITIDSTKEFERIITTSEPFYITASSKTTFTVTCGDSVLFERTENDFYYENYVPKKLVGIRTYASNYVRKISPLKKGETTIRFKSHNTLNNLSHLTVSQSPPQFDTLDVKKLTLPVYEISTKSSIKNESKIPVKLDQLNNKNFDGKKTSLEIRGQTSRSFPKKQFNIGLKKFPKLLEGKTKGVLYGPYIDRSLIRNVLAYKLGISIGVDAPSTSFCHLVINNNYEGIYVLLDKPQPTKNESLIKIDDKKTFSTSNRGAEKLLKKIPYQLISLNTNKDEALKEATHAIELLENDKSLANIDLASFAKYIIIHELARNVDSYRKSVYLSLNHDDNMLYAGPLWDFDLAFGLPHFHNGLSPEGFVYNYQEMAPWIPFWWEELMKNKRFLAELKNQYAQLRNNELSEKTINVLIDSILSDLKSEQHYNFKRWDVLNTEDFWPNHFVAKSHENEIAFIKQWLSLRLKWLDKQWLN